MKKQSLWLLLLVAACTAGNVRYEERIIIEEPYLPESEKRYIGAPGREFGHNAVRLCHCRNQSHKQNA